MTRRSCHRVSLSDSRLIGLSSCGSESERGVSKPEHQDGLNDEELCRHT